MEAPQGARLAVLARLDAQRDSPTGAEGVGHVPIEFAYSCLLTFYAINRRDPCPIQCPPPRFQRKCELDYAAAR